MTTKFVIFLPISVLLVATIYGSFSVSDVCAKQVALDDWCTTAKNPDGTSTQTCCVYYTDTVKKTFYTKCTICAVDGTKTCSPARIIYESKLFEKLPGVTAPITTNDTKVPKTDTLKGGALLEEDNNTKVPKTDLLPDGDLPPLTRDDNDTKGPKAPRVPGDLGGLKGDE